VKLYLSILIFFYFLFCLFRSGSLTDLRYFQREIYFEEINLMASTPPLSLELTEPITILSPPVTVLPLILTTLTMQVNMIGTISINIAPYFSSGNGDLYINGGGGQPLRRLLSTSGGGNGATFLVFSNSYGGSSIITQSFGVIFRDPLPADQTHYAPYWLDNR
jgi:hypothetical protein